MKKLVFALLAAAGLLACQAVLADGCEDKAIGKNGKPLAGAAKAAFIKKCETDAKGAAAPASGGAGCEAKAVGKNGKPLAGAAKTSFLKKCEADAQGAAK